MSTRIRSLALAAVLTVPAVPGFAQTNTVSLADARYTSTTAARVYVAARGRGHDDRQLAPDVAIPPFFQPIVARMLERSPTFRRQWARIARAANLSIALRGEMRGGQGADAWATIARDGSGAPRRITISVVNGPRTAELIAHEFEHIVEQLDGIDLRQKAAMRASGVRTCDCGGGEAFETERAIAVGQQVARELLESDDGR